MDLRRPSVHTITRSKPPPQDSNAQHSRALQQCCQKLEESGSSSQETYLAKTTYEFHLFVCMIMLSNAMACSLSVSWSCPLLLFV